MLSTLRIKNLALVSDLTLQLRAGYNAVTGETGAGKSIVIGALQLLLGERADRTLIRAGCDSCSVEAVFDLSNVTGVHLDTAAKKAPLPVSSHETLQEKVTSSPRPSPPHVCGGEGGRTTSIGAASRCAHMTGAVGKILDASGLEPCSENQLILKRTFTAGGANRQFVNGSPTTLQVLAAIGRLLVDMHGPHEHQSLLHPARQLDILDSFAGLGQLREKFAALANLERELESQKTALVVDEQTYARQLDLLRFQVNEISSARLLPDEQDRLEQEFKRSGNAARLLELSQAALNLLTEQEDSLLRQAGELGRLLQALERLDGSAKSFLSAHEQAVGAWGELQASLRRYADTVEVDPARLSELESRVNLVQSLRRKYGATVNDVIAFGDDAEKKLRQLESRDGELARLNGELEKLRREMTEVAGQLSAQRRKAIPKLAKAAARQLEDLGFRQSHFEIAISPLAAFTASGGDQVEFQFAPNAGEPARPLRAIASSGEMSRVMLALKTVLAAEDEIPLLIFDEIDANVGGETAVVVGQKMAQIAQRHQVICITHLPAVAASASSHFVVAKREEDGRTVSEITLLDDAGRVQEITRMLGGQSEAARRHAKELLKSANHRD